MELAEKMFSFLDQRKLIRLTSEISTTLTGILTWVKKKVRREGVPRCTISKWCKGSGWWKNADCTVIIVTTQGNAIRQFFDKSLTTPLAFDFCKYLVYPSELTEDLIVKIELNF